MPRTISLDDPFTLFLFATAVVLMIGFGVGRWTNTQRARAIADWLEPGLRSLGGTAAVQKINRSAFRFKMSDARPPFQTVTTSVVLISREFLPTWLWERINSRNDLLMVHVTFREPPVLEGEIVDPDNELGRKGEAQAQALNWSSLDIPPRWRVYHAPDIPDHGLEKMANYLTPSPLAPWRVALRRNAPHLLLNMPMPDLEEIHSRELAVLLKKLSTMAHTASEQGGDNR